MESNLVLVARMSKLNFILIKLKGRFYVLSYQRRSSATRKNGI